MIICTYAGYVIVGAHPLRQQSVPNFPGKYRGTLPLVLRYFADHFRRRYPRFASSDGSWSDGASLIISPQNLAHTPIGHLNGQQYTQFTYII